MSDPSADLDWDPARWVEILDRIEHRRSDIGLRFWGPPLWLEVTMVGPDSDLWPAIADAPRSWDWQSSAPCLEVASLADDGADDDCLLAVVGRYTIENLILNAVHEIGEWLRFDGCRIVPAHSSLAAARPDGEDQGNGAVTVRLAFGPATRGSAPVAASSANRRRGHRLLRRLADSGMLAGFTYLPDTSISCEVEGPVIRRWVRGEPPTTWRSAWSSSTFDAIGSSGSALADLVGRDVHRALVLHEADRICRAFHVDGRRPWTLDACEVAPGADPPDAAAHDLARLSILIDHADAPA